METFLIVSWVDTKQSNTPADGRVAPLRAGQQGIMAHCSSVKYTAKLMPLLIYYNFKVIKGLLPMGHSLKLTWCKIIGQRPAK